MVRAPACYLKGCRFNAWLGPICCCCFPEHEILFTLLQSTQLINGDSGELVSTGEAAHPAVTSMGTWYELRKQESTTVYISLMDGVQVGPWVPTPLVSHGQTAFFLLLCVGGEKNKMRSSHVRLPHHT